MQQSNLSKKIYSLLLTVLFVLPAVAQQRNSVRDEQIYKLNLAAQSILVNYVDDVDKTELVENAIKGMLEDLDPHSSYLNPEEVKRANEPLKGNFKGVGIEFNILKDTLLVVAVIEGGPSDKAGLRPGDRIIYVDDENIAGIGLTNKGVVDRLRGEEGSTVNIKVARRGANELLDYNIKRGKIPLYSVDAFFMVDKTIGYIKINRFSATTYDEFMKAMKSLKRDGMKKLILDLQGNGGGYLTAAIQVANEFIAEDELIVYTKDRFSRSDKLAMSKGMFEKQDMVVLVDEGSASASEILTGAIQDLDRGVVIGRRTFGKGLVQRPFRLPDGSEMRLTISRYYTPSGRSIQKSYENGRSEYRNDLQNRVDHGELFYADSIEFPDSLKFKTLKSKRTVYGGGGIMPDIFVPLDTTYNSAFFRDVNRSGVINRFTLNYVDQNRDQLLDIYPKYEDFAAGFKVDSLFYKDLINEAKRDDIAYTDDSKASDEVIHVELKAFVARYLYDRQHYYRVMKSEDEIFTKAVKVLNDEVLYQSLLSPIAQQ